MVWCRNSNRSTCCYELYRIRMNRIHSILLPHRNVQVAHNFNCVGSLITVRMHCTCYIHHFRHIEYTYVRIPIHVDIVTKLLPWSSRSECVSSSWMTVSWGLPCAMWAKNPQSNVTFMSWRETNFIISFLVESLSPHFFTIIFHMTTSIVACHNFYCSFDALRCIELSFFPLTFICYGMLWILYVWSGSFCSEKFFLRCFLSLVQLLPTYQ